MFQASSTVTDAHRPVRIDEAATVFVVDEDISVRESLEALFSSAGLQALTFTGVTEFVAYPRTSSPSCLIIDITLTDVNRLDMQQQFPLACVSTPIVFISCHIDIPATVRAMRGGAVDVLVKPLPHDLVLDAVRRAIAASTAALRREAEMRALRDRHAALTRREAQVMALVVAGRLNKQVAADLNISEITVKAHRGRLVRKMMARSLPDLVRMAAKLEIAG